MRLHSQLFWNAFFVSVSCVASPVSILFALDFLLEVVHCFDFFWYWYHAKGCYADCPWVQRWCVCWRSPCKQRFDIFPKTVSHVYQVRLTVFCSFLYFLYVLLLQNAMPLYVQLFWKACLILVSCGTSVDSTSYASVCLLTVVRWLAIFLFSYYTQCCSTNSLWVQQWFNRRCSTSQPARGPCRLKGGSADVIL